MGKNKTPGTKRDATDGIRQKRGGGKREKRQQDAVIPKSVLIADGVIDVKKTKNRSRTAKKQRQAQKVTSDDIIKKMEADLSSDEEVEEEVKQESKEEEAVVEAVVSAGKTKLDLMADDDDEEEEENDEPELGSDSEDEIDADVAEDMLGEELMSDEDGAEDDRLTKIGKKTDKIGEMIKEGKETNIELHIDTLDELPSKAELENNNLTDVDVLQDRIRRNIATLKAFTKHRNEKYSRTEYLTVLKADLCSYYGYNDYSGFGSV
jgi:ribosomal RNA methyltransferase Nop2